MQGFFGLFTKIKKKSLGLAFGAHFCMIIHKNVPYLTLYQLIKFLCHDDVIKFKIYL